MELLNPVLVSVLAMIILCLCRLNVILSLLIAGLIGGVAAGLSIKQSMDILISGMGDNAETALSYILLGAYAIAISQTGLAGILSNRISSLVKGKKVILIFIIVFIACLSQNLIPIHIAFIPILIPPLLGIMNKFRLDRRAMACGLTFGLKAPYIMLPVGFGLVFHNLIKDQMIANGVSVETSQVWKSMLIPGLGMFAGLLIAVFITYSGQRNYKTSGYNEPEDTQSFQWNKSHTLTLISAISAFVVQLSTESLPLGALTGLGVLLISGTLKWSEMEDTMKGGLQMMAFIAIVMLVASGYGKVLRETDAVQAFVGHLNMIVGNSKVLAALFMLLTGLLVTMGIGTSFGTIPILATIFCPLGIELGFSAAGIIVLLGVAGALGDAGSPASDSTLGPTSGLNMDNQHDHIKDTCIPTFLHFNIPLIIFGLVASLIL
ncbi:Na+/H+ antiporter family protein [Aureibacter tunicatorum]|uniref:Sodium:proton antiporter n=1 Tax=Aureibacter tunicatorum TaxID=866807 RepID=A0AAE3XP81_9BACT|nr:Na+/H+ antiporter NhaC family protein [Aureibacter tunicatorum]MDR6239401.1 hypothetical protein [Aureibacter tunicatorum]BDD04676.1 sodium:proton antiporter [Aureibacter tunicatorum]